jgi:hypothetical protein
MSGISTLEAQARSLLQSVNIVLEEDFQASGALAHSKAGKEVRYSCLKMEG